VFLFCCLLQAYLLAHEAVFPEYVDEIRGLAEGSGTDFTLLFALNILNELAGEMKLNQTVPVPMVNKGCTDYHLMLPSAGTSDEDGEVVVQAWGHNEDGEPASIERETTYLVASNITTPGQPSRTYLAFTYPGRLSGWAWGFNGDGE